MTPYPSPLGPDEFFAQVQQWQELTSQPAPAVEPHSALAGDAKRCPEHQVAHTAWYALGHAIDQLHAFKTLVDDARVLHAYALYSLLRAAIENAATAVWLLAPASRKERLQRCLRLAHNEAREQGQARALVPDAYPEWVRSSETRIAEIKDLATRLDLDYGRIGGRFSYERIVKAAGDATDFGDDFAAFIWRLCSGFSHGRYWSVLGMLTRKPAATDEAGVHNFSLTVDLHEVLTVAHVPFAFILHALQLHERRRQSPYRGTQLEG